VADLFRAAQVDPPNWWTGSTVNPVRVLIRGQNLTGARVAPLERTEVAA
jgi:hypothetical protein